MKEKILHLNNNLVNNNRPNEYQCPVIAGIEGV